MFTRLPRFLLVLALASSIGLHWAFLQSVAWVGMIASYSRNATLGEAVVKTFDGQHPCKLCKKIASSSQSERKAEYGLELKKFEFPYAAVAFIFRGPSLYWEVRAGNNAAKLLNRTPPIPPPRISYV